MSKSRTRLYGCIFMLGISSTLQAQTDTLSIKALRSSTDRYHLLYQDQKKKLSTGSVVQVAGPDLQKTLQPSFGGFMSGRFAGVFFSQSSGEPGNDDVSVFVRGQAPLVLVDGTPQSFISFNPEQIESITVLKDAVSTATLGMRASGGAILITTKKGSRYGQKIELNATYGLQRPTALPKFLGAFDYARLYNEALTNEGRSPIYSQADLDAFQNGSDPIGHPDVDWQKDILQPQASISRYDLSISGGGKTARYFVNMDYMHQEGLFKRADFNVYNTNADYKRFIFRSNVEADLTKAISTSLNLFGRVQNSSQPGATTASVFSNLRNTPNNAYPVFNTDGSLGGTLDYQNNLYGQILMSGYRPVYERDFKADLAIKANLNALAKGMWFRALAAINAYQRETSNRSKTFAVFKETTGTAGKVYSKYGITGDQANATTVNSQNRLFYTEASLGYSKTIKGDNNIDAVFLVNNDYRMINTDLPFNYTGVSAKISYDHKETYLAELAMAYNGTERYPKGNRYGFFPAIGLGWNISNESFLQNKPGWLADLKLRASFGKTGNANVGYYDYYQYYVTGNGYGFGSTVPSSTTTLTQGQLANPYISWEKANKFNVGAEASLFKNKLSVAVDYFNDKYYDLVQQRGNGSELLGTGYVFENIGSNRYSGIEFDLKWQDTKGAFSYFIAPNFSLLKSKVLSQAEPNRMYEWMRRTGRPVGQIFGYVADGLFNSQAEINSHAFQGGSIVPGDIRYKDLNGDKIIDGNDVQAIGNTKALIYYGANIGAGFKGFDLEVLLQGVANNNIMLTSNDHRAFQNDGRGQAYETQLNRWTPTNTANPSYPRLWLGYNANNMATSSYWLRSGAYMRVKNIELGYTLPLSISKKAAMTQARIFVGSTNALTLTSLDGIDPEGYAGGYPIMKTLHAGINIKF